jgi:uncharacterized membrane protein YuzA (DUF378 family)
MSLRSVVKRAVPVLVLFLAGVIVVLLFGASTIGTAVGYALTGLAAILLVGLAFYEVGLSEDRDRERRGGRS